MSEWLVCLKRPFIVSIEIWMQVIMSPLSPLISNSAADDFYEFVNTGV